VVAQRPRIALVVWSGVLGGAETWSASMARAFRRAGADATVVSITESGLLGDRLADMGVPLVDLRLSRGGMLPRAAPRYASAMRQVGTDGAILMTSGYMATCLRMGGYTMPIVGVEHGHILQASSASRLGRRLELLDLYVGAHCVSAQVAVSKFMLRELKRVPHHRQVVTIPNGVNLEEFAPVRDVLADGREAILGWAGRMIPGKGVDDLLRAFALIAETCCVRLCLAGDGPERNELEALATRLGVATKVRFLGRQQNMSAFWNRCDIAVGSSSTFVESFGLSPLEASACGRPVVATQNGGYADVVKNGRTGRLVPVGDPRAMASALTAYLGCPALAREDGTRGRARAEAHFDICKCAEGYLELLRSVRRMT
jgi:glycosyltransferase involved in cell wall biosynthesis